jgi:hypothetical protein
VTHRFSQLLLFAAVLRLPAAAPSAEDVAFFEKRIRPLLIDACYTCHSAQAEEIKGGLRLDSPDAVARGGEGGAVIVPGDPERSRLILAVRRSDPHFSMPPKQALSEDQVRDLEEWVRRGAPDPRADSGPATAGPPTAASSFWSFRPPADPTPPTVRDAAWPRDDLDRFVLARLEAEGLAPAPDAPPGVWLRRVTFDLTGLPPTPEEMDAFLADPGPAARNSVVERLLASPAYGERWARHWLDVVRYADTSGCNSDYPIPEIRRYRDWVVDAIQQDLPYDRFLRAQIAGDLLPAADEAERQANLVATGYLANTRRFGSRASEFHLSIEDAIDNLGKATLGLSLGCARCHDHKYDPVSQADYYALYGFFQSTVFAFPGTEIYKNPKDFVPLAPAEQGRVYVEDTEELAALDDRLEALRNRRRALDRRPPPPKPKPEPKAEAPPPAAPPAPVAAAPVARDNDSAVERQHLVKLPDNLDKAEADRLIREAEARRKELRQKTYPFPLAYAVRDGSGQDAKLHRKGDPKALGEVVPRRFLTVLGGATLPPDTPGSGRLHLAEWITSPDNPLTARVLVNRIWQHHFGQGLVRTPNDFGLRGEAPTHPELLDHLARRFLASGGSLKTLHRALVLSRTYGLASTASPERVERDPDNRLLSRFSRRRLSAEEIRDAMLHVSGRLRTDRPGEHPFPPRHQWGYTQHVPFVADYDHDHRSLYLLQQRIRRQPFLELFDGADPNATTAVRTPQAGPLQALFLLNSPFMQRVAESFAARVQAEADEAGRIDRAHRLALGRPATEAERASAQVFLAEAQAELTRDGLEAGEAGRAAWTSYARVLLSSSEFLSVD